MIKLDLQKHTDPINYLATDTELTAVADAIREKGGTSAALEFPSGFVSAIGNISTGASAEPLTVTQNGTYTAPTGTAYTPVTVNVPGEEVEIIDTVDEHGGTIRTINTGVSAIFIDYDGTEICRKSRTEINAMSSDSDLPANPSHTGLTAQGWNWTVAQLKAQFTADGDQDIIVGQMYVTTSGATEIDVEMQEGVLNPILTICPKGTISIDWGDNTTPDSVTGSSYTTRLAPTHTYASAGRYTIKISKTSGNGYGFYGSSSYLLLRISSSQNNNFAYSSCVKRIRMGLDAQIGDSAFVYCRQLESITLTNQSNNTIGSSAFNYCNNLKSATIPKNVTGVNGNLFYGCYNLINASVPSGTTYIGQQSFRNCYNLRNITIPSGVTSFSGLSFSSCYTLPNIKLPSGVTTIDYNAFEYCKSIQNITIPSGVTSIAEKTFYYCDGLKSVIIPNTVTIIGNGAFHYCRSLQRATIPSSVTSIGKETFYYCNSLKEVTINCQMTEIKESMFGECASLANITIPSGVTNIDKKAFYDCVSLEEINIPSGVTNIGDSSFYNCYALKKINIPNDVTNIGASAFSYCYSITIFTIPSSVTSIGNSAFSYCYGAKEYHFERTTPPTLGTDAFKNIVSDCIIYVPYSADHSVLEAYQSETNWSNYASYMQEEPA